MNPDTDPLFAETSQGKDYIPLSCGAPIISTQPTITASQPMGPTNCTTVCYYCKAVVKTTIKRTATTRTHLIALLCSLPCCCCCIPYCMDSTRNTDHYCPRCDAYLGTYQK